MRLLERNEKRRLISKLKDTKRPFTYIVIYGMLLGFVGFEAAVIGILMYMLYVRK